LAEWRPLVVRDEFKGTTDTTEMWIQMSSLCGLVSNADRHNVFGYTAAAAAAPADHDDD